MKILFTALAAISLVIMGPVYAQCQAGMPVVDGACIPRNALGVPGNHPSPAAESVQPSWKTIWGAVAIDGVLGKMGVAENQSNSRDAERLAVKGCQADGGSAAECKKLLNVWANGCGVVAWGADSLAIIARNTKQQAAEEAMAACSEKTRDCQIYYTSCNLPVLVRE